MFRNLFRDDAKVDIEKKSGEHQDCCKIEIKKDPKVPLTEGEKEFLTKLSELEWVEVLFY